MLTCYWRIVYGEIVRKLYCIDGADLTGIINVRVCPYLNGR